MALVFYSGIIIFLIGLVMSHIVVAITRSAARAKEPMKRAHRILMWCSVGFVVLGFLVAAASYIILNVMQPPS